MVHLVVTLPKSYKSELQEIFSKLSFKRIILCSKKKDFFFLILLFRL